MAVVVSFLLVGFGDLVPVITHGWLLYLSTCADKTG